MAPFLVERQKKKKSRCGVRQICILSLFFCVPLMLFYLAEPQLICKMKMNDIYFETVIMRIRSDVINYLVVAAATINNHRNKKNN